MDTIKKKLNEEIESQIGSLTVLSPGSDEQSKAVETLSKLYKLRIDEEKLQIDERKTKIEEERLQIEEGRLELEKNKSKIDEGKLELEEGRLELEKNKSKIDERKLELEEEKYLSDKDNAKTDRIVKIIVNGAELVIPLIAYGIWVRLGLRFEETGTFTSGTFRNLFQKFKPKK